MTVTHPFHRTAIDARGAGAAVDAARVPSGGGGVSTGAGVPLWGEPVRPQPVAPVLLMAIVLLLVAAPAALSSSGVSANPITLMRDIAESTYRVTVSLETANEQLAAIERNAAPLAQTQHDVEELAAATTRMEQRTSGLGGDLAALAESVGSTRERLTAVDAGLATTATGLDPVRAGMDRSSRESAAMAREFERTEANIRAMRSAVGASTTKMGRSVELVTTFATTRTRVPIAGGNGKHFDAPSAAADNTVLSVVLSLLGTMSEGGTIIVRKDSHTASNRLVGTILEQQVPNGVNTPIIVEPYDGTYGLPSATWFRDNQVGGF